MKFARADKVVLTILVLLHLLLVGLLLTRFLNFLFVDAALMVGPGSDFFSIYEAGNRFLHGLSLYVKDHAIARAPFFWNYRYLPFIGYSAGALLSKLPPFVAYYGWIFLNECLLGLNLYLTAKLAKTAKVFLVAAVPWLIFSPYLVELSVGQWSFLLASLIFWSIYGVLKNSKSIYAYVLAPLVKPNAFILLPYFLQLKKYRLLCWTAAATLITSAPYFWYFHDFKNFVQINLVDDFYSRGGHFGFKSLYYLLTMQYLQLPAAKIWFWVFTAALLIFTLYATFRYRDKVASFALWICCFFFIYKDVWEHHYVLFMPVFALLLIQARATFGKLFSKKLLLLTIAFLLIALPSLFFTEYFFVPHFPVDPEKLNPFFVVLYHTLKISGVAALYLFSFLQLKNAHKKTTAR